jgi:NodT family efflux transporter outer membrane factor (OMF) lipoprotein
LKNRKHHTRHVHMKNSALLLCLLTLCLGGCFNLSPTYVLPDLMQPMPGEYKEEEGWKTATPRETFDRGSWWEVFDDPTLNALITQADQANQNIAVAAANLRQARAQIGSARAAFVPGVGVSASATRSGAENRPASSGYSYGIQAQWEIGFWNSLPNYEAAQARATASAADFATMRLAVQAELAQSYFQLRGLDGQQSLYESTITSYRRAVQLTESQLRGGIVTRMDVDQAHAQLATAEAQLATVKRQRALLEHAIAVLIGQIPSTYSLERGTPAAYIPGVPKDLPSTLLERRPDVAAAERRVAAANQQIGMARAAWFPTLTLGGDTTGTGAVWHAGPLWTWAVGPSAALTLFSGGRRLAENDAAWAGYEAAVANYRQTVLEAFRDVEDSLSNLLYLKISAEAQGRAVKASRSALSVAESQYRGGMTTYLQVVSSQEAFLSAQRSAIELQSLRLQSTVGLFKALGGGFEEADLRLLVRSPPTMGQAER